MHESIKPALGGCVLLGLLLAAGCAEWQPVDYRTYGTSAEPVPTARPSTSPQEPGRERRTAAAYERDTAPRGGGRTLKNSMAFPTGRMETSGLLVERIAPREAVAGQPFQYEYRVVNLTDRRLEMVTLNERITGGTGQSADPAVSETREGAVTWNLGTLEPRQTKTVRVTVATKDAESVSACAWATYTPMLCSEIRIVHPSLELTCDAPAEALVCDGIPIALRVGNSGSGSLTGVRVISTMPPGYTADGRANREFEVGNLGPGESRELRFNVRGEGPGKFVGGARATSAEGLIANASCTTVLRQPSFSLTCKSPEERFMGQPFQLCFNVANKGDGGAGGAVLEVGLPQGLTVKDIGAQGRATANGLSWDLASLGANSSRDFCATVTSATVGDIQVDARIRGDCVQADTTTCRTRIVGVSGLLLEKADDPDPIAIGATTTYTVKVTNQGTADDNNISISVICPPELSPVSASSDAAIEGQKVTFPLVPRLAPKDAVTYKLVVKGMRAGDAHTKFVLKADNLKSPISAEESTHVY